MSPAELQSLGLPSTHVHYSSDAGVSSNNAEPAEELLAPSDIKVTYSEEQNDVDQEPEVLRDKVILQEDASYENYQNYNDAIFGVPEPPRALPSQEFQLHRNGDLSDRMPRPASASDEITFEDKIFTLEAMCDLDCGQEGRCLLEKLEKDSLRKRCLCPMGKTGEKCAFGKQMRLLSRLLRLDQKSPLLLFSPCRAFALDTELPISILVYFEIFWRFLQFSGRFLETIT